MNDLFPRRFFYISLLCSVAVCAGVLYYGFEGDLRPIEGISLAYLLSALPAIGLEILCRSFRLRMIALIWGHRLPVLKTIAINLSGDFANGVTPASVGGAPMRGYHLVQAGIPLQRTTAVIIGERLTDHLSLLALVVTLILFADYKAFGLGGFLPLMGGLSLGCCLLYAVFFRRRADRGGFRLGMLQRVEDSRLARRYIGVDRLQRIAAFWDGLRDHFNDLITRGRGRFFICGLLALVSQVMRLAILMILAAGLGLHIPVTACMLWLICKRYGLDSAPVPGANGITETAFVWFFDRYASVEALGPFLILWRFCTYYLYLMLGGVATAAMVKQRFRIQDSGFRIQDSRSKKIKTGLLALALLFGMAAPAAAQTVDLPLDHWAYDLLDRFDAKRLFRLVGFDARPLTRQEVVRIIRQVAQNPSALTPVERALFEELKGEFADELADTGIFISDEEIEPHFVASGRPDNRLFLDARLDERTEWIAGGMDDVRNRTVAGLRGRGRYKRIAAYAGEARLRNVNGVGPVDITVERPRGLLSGIDERDIQDIEFSGSLVFRLRWFRFSFGKGLNRWGPALRSSTIVTDQMPPFPMYKAIVNIWGLKYTYFHGFMINDGSAHVPGHPLVIPQKKYWAGHRLDADLKPWLRISGMETIVYGNRGVELLYLFPVTTFYEGEIILPGDDSRNMSFDAIIRLPNHMKLYAQLHIGDYWITDFDRFIDVFGDSSNRWGVIAGFRLVDPWGLEDTDFRAEYTRIEPFVYTQRRPWNVYQYRLRHLGSFLEPNSDNMYIEARHRPGRRWLISAHAQMTRHSDTPVNGQGDGNVFGPEDVENVARRKKDFLGGVMERTVSAGFRVRHEIFRRQFVDFGYMLVRVRPVDFPNQTAGPVSWDHRVMLNITVDY